MPTPLDHPWITDDSFSSSYRDSIVIAMKSAVAMLNAPNPPEWIVIVDECFNWFGGHTARTRFVVDVDTTVDAEGHGVAVPTTTVLTEPESQSLLKLLDSVSPSSLANSTEAMSLEGVDYVVMVANGHHHWCEFAQFRLGVIRMKQPEEQSPGHRIKDLAYSLRSALEADEDGR